jgi:hypothetical protein
MSEPNLQEEANPQEASEVVPRVFKLRGYGCYLIHTSYIHLLEPHAPRARSISTFRERLAIRSPQLCTSASNRQPKGKSIAAQPKQVQPPSKPQQHQNVRPFTPTSHIKPLKHPPTNPARLPPPPSQASLHFHATNHPLGRLDLPAPHHSADTNLQINKGHEKQSPVESEQSEIGECRRRRGWATEEV